MARKSDKRQLTRWTDIQAGDIISFHYKSKNKTRRLNTVLVLNPRILDENENLSLVGLKISEGSGQELIPRNALLRMMKKIGRVIMVDDNLKIGEKVPASEEIYRIVIKEELVNPWPKGAKSVVYKKIKSFINDYKIYRTYDYNRIKKSIVYLEPIYLKGEGTKS